MKINAILVVMLVFAIMFFVQENLSFQANSDIDPQVVKVGDRVILKCIFKGTPLRMLPWSKDSDIIPGTYRSFLNSTMSTLVIPKATTNEACTYTCVAENETISNSSKFVIYIRADSYMYLFQRKFDPQNVYFGDTVSLKCIVAGTPLSTITWSKDDESLPRNAVIGDGILIIRQVMLHDTGNYTCVAGNYTESINYTIAIYVSDYYRGIF